MTDRELLEFAAKAAGIELGGWSEELHAFWKGKTGEATWNPRTDTADAFSLMVHLKLELSFNPHVVLVWFGEGLLVSQKVNTSLIDVTRRAIVRAAAEIGKGLT